MMARADQEAKERSSTAHSFYEEFCAANKVSIIENGSVKASLERRRGDGLIPPYGASWK